MPSRPRTNPQPPEFKYWSKLPYDLQYKIWLLSLPDGQAIFIDEEDPDRAKGRPQPVTASYKVPSALQTCQDSRKIAKLVYSYVFEDRIGSNGNGVWMDLSRDVLTFASNKDVVASRFFGIPDKRAIMFRDERRPIRKPVKEKLAMIAFRYFPSHVDPSPSNLDMMGKPDQIYMVRFSGQMPPKHSIIALEVVKQWQQLNVIDAVKLLYLEPEVEVLTYGQLGLKLLALGEGVVKARRAIESGGEAMETEGESIDDATS